MKPFGLLGCGNIAAIIARELPSLNCVAVYDVDPGKTLELADLTGAHACESFEEFSRCDFARVVEAASVEALVMHGEAILSAGKDLLALSAGAFLDTGFRANMTRLARQSGRRIQIPSGAVFGLDNLQVGQLSAVDRVTLRTTKSPAALAPNVTERTCLFRGSVVEAIQRYPKNINVGAALSLAAGKEVEVELWVDPLATRNTHEVLVRGRFGEVTIHIANNPCPDNPRTSYLAALSVMAVLSKEDEVFIVGN
jgi:aspartate dehydrogenase